MRLRTLASLAALVAAAVAYRHAVSDAAADVVPAPRVVPAPPAGTFVARAVVAPIPHVEDADDDDVADHVDGEDDGPVIDVGALATDVAARRSNLGAIRGRATDEHGEPLPGVVVAVSSSAHDGTMTAITDEDGAYAVTALTAGTYTVDYYYADVTIERQLEVGAGFPSLAFAAIPTTTIPTIDPGSTVQGITIDQNYIWNIPVPGRTFEATLGAAAGSQEDGTGVSFSGGSSLENTYVIDDEVDDDDQASVVYTF